MLRCGSGDGHGRVHGLRSRNRSARRDDGDDGRVHVHAPHSRSHSDRHGDDGDDGRAHVNAPHSRSHSDRHGHDDDVRAHVHDPHSRNRSDR